MQAPKVGRPKSKQKREAILNAAQVLFLANGVKQTSMEEVAKHSGVSKQTVYSHYRSKDALFSAVIKFKCEEYLITNEGLAESETSLEKALTQIGTKFLGLFHDEAVVSVYSTMIAEARNAPHMAELFYETGPLASIKALAEVLHELSDIKISKANAHALAIDFYGFIKGEFHTQSLMNMDFRLKESEREAYVAKVVEKTLCLLNNYYSQD